MTIKTRSKSISAKANRKRRLIELGTLGIEASTAGLAERYGRGKTPHTGQVWWARRPHAAMRVAAFSTLARESEEIPISLISALALETEPLGELYTAASRHISEQYVETPALLDMFGGGGTIPHEAACMGAAVKAVDNNALAVFVQRVNLVYSQRAYHKLGRPKTQALLKTTGKALLERVRAETEPLFPARQLLEELGGTPFAYFWTYKKVCSECSFEFFLSKRPWLSKKPRRHQSLHAILKTGKQEIVLVAGETAPEQQRPVWPGRSGVAVCPQCGFELRNPSIKSCEDAIIAYGTYLRREGKTYATKAPKNVRLIPNTKLLNSVIERLQIELGSGLPTSKLPRWSGIVNPALYGIETHGDIFNKRQQAVCLVLLAQLRRSYADLSKKFGRDVAMFIAGSLSALVDQLVDWNCRLSMWIPQNEQVGRAFCGPGISMFWDYVESDPLVGGPANLWDKLERVFAAAEAIPVFESIPDVVLGKAQSLPFEDNSIDAIVTDPPYYDNIFYNVLADNFYSWKRMTFRCIEPDLFAKELTNDVDELVASKIRQGSSAAAHEWYCRELTKALSEGCRVLKPDGIMSFVYGHSSLLGWEAIVRSFRECGLLVESVEPLSIERRQRPRAMRSEAVNTCIVIVAKKALHVLEAINLDMLKSQFKAKTFGMIEPLREAGWADADVGMALFANAVGLLARVSRVEGYSDQNALICCEETIRSAVPGFSMQKRKSI